jgi:hypothetical protein
MAMDAKRCRDNVNRCIELANDAKDAETRLILFELVKGWLEAAAKFRRGNRQSKAGRTIKKSWAFSYDCRPLSLSMS